MNWKYIDLDLDVPRGKCTFQAASLVTGIPIETVAQELTGLSKALRLPDPVQNGMSPEVYETWLRMKGYTPIRCYTETIEDLPEGRFVVELSDHATAVIDGEIWDFQDSRGRRVYQYWMNVTLY
jgi:hypothetical protein